jgi:uncharacterized protein (DUF1778 family)
MSSYVHITGLTRTDVALQASRIPEQKPIPERSWYSLAPEVVEAFRRQHDASASPNERLQRTLSATKPWTA